jgi:hypothetical protein
MKKLHLLLFSFAFLFTYAQTDFRFADSTAQWNVITADNGMWCNCISYFTTTYTVIKDTIVAGNWYQKLRDDNGQTYFIRQDSLQQVFYRNTYDSTEFKIYDFGKQAGDTFRMASQYSGGFGGVLMYVCSTDSVNFDKPRKRVFLSPFDSTGCNSPHNIAIEGIGMLNAHLLYPELENYIFDGQMHSLLCFSENSAVIYHQPGFASCQEDTFYYVSSPKLKEEADVRVYSSQSERDGSIIVQLYEQTSVMSISLYDLTGRLLLQKELTEQTTRIDCSALAKGVYFYQVVSNKQRIKSDKLLLE